MTKNSQVKKSTRAKAKDPIRGINPEVKTLLLIGFPILLIALALAAFANANRAASPTTVDDTQLIRADSPTLGPSSAQVTVVEFLDPECESCRAVHPIVKELLSRYEGRLRLIVRYFPLHNNSVLAARATEAAGLQGKYWEMQDMLFTRQTEWGEQQASQKNRFIDYARQLGLNVEQFTADLGRAEFLTKIQRDQADGKALGVTGTPTFFINGSRLQELSYDALINAIETQLKR